MCGRIHFYRCLLIYATLVSMGPYSEAKEWAIKNGLDYDVDVYTADDSQGRALLVPYALNIGVDESRPAPQVSGGSVELSFYAAKDDITYRVEVSDDMVTWSDTGVVLAAQGSDGFRTASKSLSGTAQFLRIVVAVK